MPERGNYRERRGHRREGVDSPMRFSLVETGEIREAVARDLSATGMSIETREPVAVGAILDVVVAPLQPAGPPLEAEVEVLRMDSMRDDLFQLGVIIRKLKQGVLPAG
ncbi:MAG: PilZ domain-containing protein [Gemmatimonadota bacterium]